MKYSLASLLILIACSNPRTISDDDKITIADSYFKGEVVLSSLIHSDGFKILLRNASGEILDQLIFKYTSYHLDTADVNRDGRTEILVGLVKETEFDPSSKKRLFIIRIDEGQLRPLWLGSRVCQELVDFRTKTNGVVQTLEKTKKGNYAIGNYQWQGFGLTLIKYIGNEISLDDASELFND